jgi:PAS domain S-box-containing protein
LSRKSKNKKDIEKELKNLQKKVEKLRVKVSLLDALLESIPDLIYFKDRESRFLEVSKSKAEQVGLKREEVLGKTDFDYFTEEHAKPAYEDEQEIIKTGKPILNKVEKETHPDGRITWVSTTKVPRYDEKGNIIGILGVSRDVTERKALEEKLKLKTKELGEEVVLKSNLLKALMEHIPDRIYFKDKESRFLAVSKSKAEGTGLSREEFKGKTDFDFFPEEEAKILREDEIKIMEMGKPVISKMQKVKLPNNEEKWYSVTKVPFYDNEGKVIGTLGISRDVTRLKTLELEKEKKLKAQREELEVLSTPVIDVWEGILAVPVLGIMDSERASRISEALLTRIVETRSWAAIVDISGISAVDSAVADLLIRTAQAVKFVGAEVVLTGVGVEIAQTIADLGIDMKGLKTMSTLKDGLKYVINRKREI